MLTSIEGNLDVTNLALAKAKRHELILTADEGNRIHEIIQLLTEFKKKTDYLAGM